MGIRGKGTIDGLRTLWTPEMDRYFVDLMVEQLNKGNRFDDLTFSKTAWMNMNSCFNHKFKFEYELDVLKNRHKTMRILYKAVNNLLNQKGFSWDSTRQMVIADNKTWDEYIKINPDVRPYRVKTIPYYDDMCLIYGDNLAGKKGSTVPETSSQLGEDKTGSATQPECGNEATMVDVHETAVGEDCISVAQEEKDTPETTPNSITNPMYRVRMYWQPPMDRFFIDLMLEQLQKGNQIDGVFCKEAWIEMITSFNAKFGCNYDMEILKNRFKTLKRQYNVIKNILKLDGFSWDDDRQLVIADDSVWQDYIKGHKEARQFMTRPVPYYKDLCLICLAVYPNDSDCFSLQSVEPKNGVREVKQLRAGKCSRSPVASVSNEDEIGDVLEPAHLNSNTNGSNRKCKRQQENVLSCAHSKKSRGEDDDDDGMASGFRERASSKDIVIENVITAVQALPDMDEEFILDACEFLEDEIKARTFMALDVKLRKKWLLRKLRPQL